MEKTRNVLNASTLSPISVDNKNGPTAHATAKKSAPPDLNPITRTERMTELYTAETHKFRTDSWEGRVLRGARDWCADRDGRPVLPDGDPVIAKTDHHLEMVVYQWMEGVAAVKFGCACPECGAPVECVSIGHHVDREDLEAARRGDY